MLLSTIVLVLILAIAYFQASQGWYSALIMTVLTVTCAALAFGAYDFVAVNYIAPYWKPSYAHGIALAALFGVPLIVLRLIFDRSIRRTALLPVMIDRVGGGVCGFITSLTMVGVFALTAQLLPFDKGAILGFSRVDVADPSAEKPAGMEQADLWLSPDRFAAGLGTMLSAGIFGGGPNLYHDHPDLVREAGWTNAVPTGVSRYAGPGSISVVGTELLTVVYTVEPARDPKNNPPSYLPTEASAGNEFRLVKVKLGDKAKDERKSHLFTLRQFRLAGRKPDSNALTEVHAIGIQQEQNDPTNRYIRFKKGKTDLPVVDTVYSPKGGDTVEVVFEVPKGFQPTHVSYKRGARTAISFEDPAKSDERRSREKEKPEAAGSTPPTPPSATPTPPTTPPGENVASGRGRGGNIRGITTKAGRSFFGDELPLELKAYRGSNIEQRGGAMASGSLVAELDKQAEGKDPPIRKLTVPEDQRLLQLSISKLEAKSGLGRIMSHAVGTIENYSVKDSSGGVYVVVGKYAIADVNGSDMMELQYFGGAEGGAGHMRPFDKIKDTHLKGEYGFVLLFLVKPGAHITSFSSGGEASRADDLTGENLTAPP
jgi:uncharacterized membrane protein required for colicin V production